MAVLKFPCLTLINVMLDAKISLVPTHQLIVRSTLLAPTTNISLYKATKIHTLKPLKYEQFFQNSSKRGFEFSFISFTGHLVQSPQFLSPFLLGSWQDLNQCVVPENIHTTPTEGIRFSRGEGGSICLIFQWGGGVHLKEIFPEGSRDA